MYSKMGDFKNAILTNNEALKKLKSIFGEYHPLIFSANNNLALNYADSGNFNKSLEILNLNVENVSKFWGKDNIRSIPTYNNLATLYYESGDYLKSIDILENNLAIEKKYFGESHVKTCIVLNNLANSYLAVGDYAKSLDAFEKTLKITQAYYGDDHYKTAKLYANLACFYLETSDTDKALYYAKISYEILKQRSIDNAIEYSSILNTLAVIYNATGQKKAAFESYQQSLAIVEQKQGFFHPDTALLYHNLGCVSESLGDLKNAIVFSTNALNIRKNVFGSKHHSTAQSYNALGYLKYLNNEFDDAINLYRSALEIQSNTFGDDNLETIVTLDNIISYYYTLKKYDITMEYIDRVLIARKDLLQKVMLLGEKSRFAWQDKFRSFAYASILPPNRAADFLLWQKGIVLDSLLEDRAVALASAKTGEGAQGLQNIAQLRSKLSKIVFEQGTEKEAADLENEIGFLQRNLAQKFLHRGTQRPSLNFTMADIAPSLSAGLILLDFFYFHDPHAVKDQESERLVVIMTGHDNKPTLFWIEQAADIRSSIEALRKAINQGDLEGVHIFTTSLSEKLWAPIAAKIPVNPTFILANLA
jgi:tetratricopeptide (TPR) repeat protein